jgi:hypothetical protein
MKITYTDSRDGMVLIGFTDERGEREINAFTELAPTNAAEVLLCSQMVATWEVGMAMVVGAKMATDLDLRRENGALAAKLLSIFERQFSTLTKSRRPPQVVTVEHVHKHLHVNGQPPGPVGDLKIIEDQARGTTDPRTLALAPGPALLGQDPPRDALPIATDKARPVPNARRRARDRRTKR